MKKIIYLFSIIAFALVAFSCEDDYTRSPEGAVDPTAPVFDAPGTSSVQITTLDNEVVDAFLVRLNWSKVRFTYENGLPAEVGDLKYTVEVDIAGEFPQPAEVITTDLLYTDLFSLQLNNLILSLYGERTESESADLMFRVKTTDNLGKPVYSNLISLKVEYVSADEPPAPEVTIHWKQVEVDWEVLEVYAWGE
jgi:hypothetical protein